MIRAEYPRVQLWLVRVRENPSAIMDVLDMLAPRERADDFLLDAYREASDRRWKTWAQQRIPLHPTLLAK